MANVFTNLEPDLYRAMDVVSREMVGFIPAVMSDMSVEEVSKDRVIRSFVAPASSAADTTPGQLPPDTGDQTFTNRTLTISKDRHVPIRWTAEDQLQMNAGPGYNPMRVDQFAQAMRTLVNEVEADLAALYVGASRAAQPLGTTLFDSTGGIKDLANVRQILIDNGAPMGDISYVANSQAHIDLLGIPNLYKANEADDNAFLRQGSLGQVFGIDLRHSGSMSDHTIGTGSGYLVNSASLAVGDTVIPVDTGSGTILAGDVISFAGDSNLYVVASALSGGNVTIAAPGLLAAPADNAAVTVESDVARNMIFSRNAIALATRLPALPAEGDSAEDRFILQDPRSGLAFSILLYKEYKRIHFEVGLAWGAAVMKPEHLALHID